MSDIYLKESGRRRRSLEQRLAASRRARRERLATKGWEKDDWGGQFATWPDNATDTDKGRRGFEDMYRGDATNTGIKHEWEAVREPSWGKDKRDPMTYHARRDRSGSVRLSKTTLAALEKKAAKALVLAKTLLGKAASVESLRDQATELMDLPTRTLNSTLKRILSAEGDIDEASLQEKVEKLLESVEEVAEAAGVEVGGESEDASEEDTEEVAEDAVEEESEEAADLEESLEGLDDGAEDQVMSEEEISDILLGEGEGSELEASVDTFNASSLADQLFGDKFASLDEVSKIEKRVASTKKKGVKNLVAMTKSEAQGAAAEDSLWKVMPDVKDIFQ